MIKYTIFLISRIFGFNDIHIVFETNRRFLPYLRNRTHGYAYVIRNDFIDPLASYITTRIFLIDSSDEPFVFRQCDHLSGSIDFKINSYEQGRFQFFYTI